MKKKIVVKKTVREKVADPFDCGLSLREIARRTGLDIGYLSRVRSGELELIEENLKKILKVTQNASRV